MKIEDINSLGEKEFIDYPLDKTIEVLKVIENLNWVDPEDKNLNENEGFYSNLLDIVADKINGDLFSEILEDDTQKNLLMLRILRIRTNITQYRLVFLSNKINHDFSKKFENTEKAIRDADIHMTEVQNKLSDSVQAFEKTISEAKNQMSEIKTKISDEVKAFEDTVAEETQSAIKEIQPQLMTIVLTLMGVFSAIITIVMSVVITSNSWLNNASNASAILAFIIPNLVVIFAIIVLLRLVFNKTETVKVVPVKDCDDWNISRLVEKDLKKSKRLMKFTVFLILFLTTILISISLICIKKDNVPHKRYVLTQETYSIVEIEESTTNKKQILIEFNINQNNYQFQYDEDYFHDGFLYFCEEHNRLE